MRHKVIIRQERPRYTRAPFGSRTWELSVRNQLTGKYEYYGFTATFDQAVELAQTVWWRSNNISPLALREPTA